MGNAVTLRALVAGAVLVWLAGCGDPLSGVGRLSELDLADETPVAVMADPSRAEEPVARPGLLGRMLGGGGSAKAPPSVPAGTLLSFGLVKPVCDLPRDKRGAEIAAFPERRAAYRLYDSAPGKTAPHPFYVTGFDDGCARTFTAAVAMFGAPEMHEMLRYGLPAEVHPYSATDSAYEQIKSRVCRVARGAPCGDRVGKLEKDTVFVSAYEQFGDNARWLEMLLHGGTLVETDVKSGG
ncbi:hypothetical protein [Marinovum sp.]|uniref:hypothetical protein n=1 Tax=Marinovum sp. TaxID=2024839 RepID=UPI002B275BA2|nr:hypothetical protein [Marinovum sp.]